MDDKRQYVLSRNGLKIIALVAMICDHIGAVGFKEMPIMYFILRLLIGRMVFPIFCTLFVDSFFYIKKENRLQHLGLLAFFTLVSEIPFDMMHGSVFDPSSQSVMLTWTLSFVLMWLMSVLYDMRNVFTDAGSVFISIGLIVLFMFAGVWLCVDYKWSGIASAGICYLFKEYDRFMKPLVMGIIVCLIIWAGSGYLTVFLALPFLALYDGHTTGRRMKYLYYIVYPTHMFLLGLYAIFG